MPGSGDLGGAWWRHILQSFVATRALIPEEEAMTKGHDLRPGIALTKVIAEYVSQLMLLVERGQVKLDAPVQTYLPEFKGDGKEKVTVRELLTCFRVRYPDIETKTDLARTGSGLPEASLEKLWAKPGTTFRYVTRIWCSWWEQSWNA